MRDGCSLSYVEIPREGLIPLLCSFYLQSLSAHFPAMWFISSSISFVSCRVSKSPRSADHSLSPRYKFLYLWLPTHRIALVELLGYCAGNQGQSASHSPIRGVTLGIFSIKLLYFFEFLSFVRNRLYVLSSFTLLSLT